MSSTKSNNRPRKHKQKDEMKQEIVAQVHKTIKSTELITNNEIEDKQNDNYTTPTTNTPSREISVDGETQINSKILSLIETEMKRDINKHSHFTDSRPQSLSFYEDEKIPEELSGNLELLSPEEKKHYKKRLTDERNVYNVIQDLYNNKEIDEILSSSTKKSKSRKKSKHDNGEIGLGDSREMMIPKEKRKSKKKKREASPMTNNTSSSNNNNNNSKRSKHKKRDEDYEPRNEITLALDELQDDVFETNPEDFISGNNSGSKPEKIRRSPNRRSERLYVQKKNKFEVSSRPNGHLNRQSAYDFGEDAPGKNLSAYHPLEIAIPYQKCWIKFSMLCHGLLSGLAFGHWLYLVSNYNSQDDEFIIHYSHFSDIYECLFYMLCVICLVAVFDKVDIANMELNECFKIRKSSIVVLLYITCLFVHLLAARIDYKLSQVSYDNETISNITSSDLSQWNHLSLWRSLLAFIAWIILGFSSQENLFYVNLKSMEKYLPQK